MRVLALAQSADGANGWGRYSVEIARALRRLGAEVELLVERGGENPLGEAEEALAMWPDPQPSGVRAILEAPGLVSRARQADLIHALDETKLPLAAALATLAARPFAVSMHGTQAVRLLEKRGFLYRPVLTRSRRLFATSDYTRRRIVQLAPELNRLIQTTPLGVSTVSDAPLPLDRRGGFALSVGAVKPRKGVLEALRAVMSLRAEGVKLALKVAGAYDPEDAYVRMLHAEATSAGDNPLELLGPVDEQKLSALMSTARVLIMPSQEGPDGFEGFGLVHLESAARGTPSIGSWDSGNEDAVLDGVTGYLIKRGDQTAIVQSLRVLATKPDRWASMSLAACRFASEMNWRRTAESTLKGYLRQSPS